MLGGPSVIIIALIDDIISSARKAREDCSALPSSDFIDWSRTVDLLQSISRTADSILTTIHQHTGNDAALRDLQSNIDGASAINRKRKRDLTLEVVEGSDDVNSSDSHEMDEGSVSTHTICNSTVTFGSDAVVSHSASPEDINRAMVHAGSTPKEGTLMFATGSYAFSGTNMKYTGPVLQPDLEERLDVVFFPYVAKLCGDEESVDSAGNLIHMTFIARKVKKLKFMDDFECFKFKPAAFMDGFKTELKREDPEVADMPNGVVKSYLLRQKFLARFTKDKKKIKTKGAPVMAVEAKKTPDGGWIFKEFEKVIIMPKKATVRVGQLFIYKPEVLDLQLGERNPIYDFPDLPPWLRWVDNVLRGSPGETDSSREVTVVALYGHTDLGSLLPYALFETDDRVFNRYEYSLEGKVFYRGCR
ncbi:hypothetical protein BC829DRAFT_380425 [Chytridium lagenaria]|nr:hypothetical protein BC829DRAFT_380425 [Chytridium lagenaria]